MTSTITITATAATAPMLSNDLVIIMLMISEIMLVGVTIFIAILAFVGAKNIKQAAVNVARESVQESARAEVEKLLDKPQISDIIKEHVERVTGELFREAQGKVSSAQPNDASTKEERNV